MKKISAIGMLVLFVASILAAGLSAGVATAAKVPVTINYVKIDGDEITADAKNPLSVERGKDTLNIKVGFTANQNADNIELSAFIKGSEHEEMSSTSDIFSVVKGVSYKEELEVEIPASTDSDSYTLKLMFNDRTRSSLTTYNLLISKSRHLVTIKDITMNPAYEVQTGRLLVARVLLKNMGDKTQDDVKVTAQIKSLGVEDSYTIESIKSGKSEETGNLQLRIPDCAEAGEYTVDVKVEYDDGEETATATEKMKIVSGDTCTPITPSEIKSGKDTVISVIADAQDLSTGAKVYPITITNNGKSSKIYILSVDSADFADVQISGGSVLEVKPGQTAVAYLTVSAKSGAQSGLHAFVVNIKSGDSVESVTLKANVGGNSAASASGLKKALEVILIVFIVILVIVVLIVLFNKLRSDDDDTSGQTYY